MPRKARIWYPGAIYHIMCRGNHRHDIFRDEEDRNVYLNYLQETIEEHKCHLYSYCLMTNHVHLQIETSNIEISKVMKRLNMMYAISFNKKYNFAGHLFQGRYKSELIKNDIYNLEISKYIHLNPVKASIVDLPVYYPWSSYRTYMGERKEKLVTTAKILSYFKNKDPLLYKEYVEQNLNRSSCSSKEG